MVQVPESPEAFFAQYLPARVARMAAAIHGKDSVGSVAFEVLGAGKWWLKLNQGTLVASSAANEDELLTVVVRAADFVPVIVGGAQRVPEELPPERQMIAARLLTLDQERARLINTVQGSLGLALADAGATRRLLIAPRTAQRNLDKPSCEIACSIEDFWAMQSGASNPFELLMNGRIRLDGDAQIAMALSGVFS